MIKPNCTSRLGCILLLLRSNYFQAQAIKIYVHKVSVHSSWKLHHHLQLQPTSSTFKSWMSDMRWMNEFAFYVTFWCADVRMCGGREKCNSVSLWKRKLSQSDHIFHDERYHLGGIAYLPMQVGRATFIVLYILIFFDYNVLQYNWHRLF